MSFTTRHHELGEKVRRLAGHLLLCLVVVLQLGATPADRMGGSPPVDPELAALASALGQPVALCHDATGNDGQPANAPHHTCCDCGMCPATAHAPPPTALAYVSARVATRNGRERPAFVFRLAFIPHVAATGPRGPPLDV